MHEQNVSETRWAQVSHWLENVFWYHYKWYYFAAVFAAVLIIVSVVSFATKVDYDWTVQYVHRGAADPASAAAVKDRFTAAGSDRSGNGKVQVQVQEHFDSAAPGREDLFGLVRDWENVLYVLDAETMERFQALGYFGEGTDLGGGLYAFVVDTPVVPYTLEEFEAYGYTEQNWRDANEYRDEQHALAVSEARQVLAALG